MKSVFATAILAASVALPAQAGSISADHPNGLRCRIAATGDRPEGISILYLSAVLVDGSVLYQTLGSQVISLTFDPSGALNDGTSDACAGMSLTELEAAGMTF